MAQTDHPNCSKGYSCDRSCISRTKQCQCELEGQSKEHAQYLQTHRKREPKLPKGVEVEDNEFETAYIFSTGPRQKETRMYFSKMGATDKDTAYQYVGFEVDGSNELDRDLSPDDARRAAVKLAQIFKYHAYQQPDGTELRTSAWEGDGYANRRSMAYFNMGFSRPVGGISGGGQYGIVRNGRLEPNEIALRRQERHPKIADERWQESLVAAQQERGARNRADQSEDDEF